MAEPESQMAGAEDRSAGIAVRLEGVVKRFGDFTAVAGVDLDVREGEFFSMLGPSGSGKTTCLRMIAGFEQPTQGRILLQGVDVSRLAPYQRDVNTVFQDYALFPHMTVRENVEYGLRVKKVVNLAAQPGRPKPSGRRRGDRCGPRPRGPLPSSSGAGRPRNRGSGI